MNVIHKYISIIYARLSSKYASGELSFNFYSKVNAFFQIANFPFFALRNLYTANNVSENNTLQNGK